MSPWDAARVALWVPAILVETVPLMTPMPEKSFIDRYFTPENRLAEVICGLVMVLSFTATTSATFEGTTPNALLIAVLGCNIAWGIVDGVTYILGNLLNRGAQARLVRTVRENPDDPTAGATVQSKLDDAVGQFLTPDQRRQLHRWVVEGAARLEPEPTRLKREDVYTAIACFMIVFGATLPALIPFMLLRDDGLALRVSNGLILLMLFAIGWRWARFANTNRWTTGLSLLGLGLILVAITIVLGG